VRLEREVEQLNDDRDFLREQIKVKDGQLAVKDQQISAMLERDRETNILVQGLQKETARGGSRDRVPEDGARCRRLFSWSMPRHARRGQGTRHFATRAGLRIGFPTSDPGARPGRWSVESRRQRPAGRALAALTSLRTMPKLAASFAERCAQMRDAAEQLKAITEIVSREALAMMAAKERFSERRDRRKART
jgi:hypothetical protein